MLHGKVDEDYINEDTRQGNKGIMHGKVQKQSDFDVRIFQYISSIDMMPHMHCIELNYNYKDP
jgi:hypothetical protein